MFIEAIRRNKLLKAVRNNDVQQIQVLIEEGVDINCAYANPMEEAITHGAIEAGKFLLDAGADPNATVSAGKGRIPSLLIRAIETNNLEFVRMLLDHPSIDPDFGGFTEGYGLNPATSPLEEAEKSGKLEAAFMIATSIATKLQERSDTMAVKAHRLKNEMSQKSRAASLRKFGV